MIDREQRVFWRLCKKSPAEFWNYSPGETYLMIEESLKEFEIEQEIAQIKHAEILTVVLNSPHQPPKDNNKLWKVEDFLSAKLKDKVAVKHTIKETLVAWEQYIRGFSNR